MAEPTGIRRAGRLPTEPVHLSYTTTPLKPGKYIFRVINKNVPYPLGFWLRGASLIDRIRLPSVSGGGLTLGASKDYVVELEEGDRARPQTPATSASETPTL